MSRLRTYLRNVLLMTSAALAMRGIGVLFNLYLTSRVGAAGLGLSSLVSSVYGFSVTLASSGIHLAVTRVTAEEEERGHSGGVRAALFCGIRYALVCGGGAGLLLFAFASPIANVFLHDVRCIPALRVLAFSLPFLSLSAVLGGYFTGTHRGALGAVIGACSQAGRILGTVWFLRLLRGQGLGGACTAIAVGALLSELSAFLVSLLLCIPEKRIRGERAPLRPVGRALLRIAVPIALTTYVRSGLLTLEHLLIPRGLSAYGAGADAALASYGTLHGMVFPILLFPSALLVSAAGLLVPEAAALRTAGERGTLHRVLSVSYRLTLLLAVFCAGVMRCFGNELGQVIFHSEEAGKLLSACAPLAVIMYLDTVTDAWLKGLDRQVASMRINIIDAFLSVILVLFLLPRFGVWGYVFVLYASELVNFGMSAAVLFSGEHVRIPWFSFGVRPILSVIGASVLSVLFFSLTGLRFRFPGVTLAVHILVCLLFYGAFLYLFGAVGKEDLTEASRLLSKKPESLLHSRTEYGKIRKTAKEKRETDDEKRHQRKQRSDLCGFHTRNGGKEQPSVEGTRQ